MSLLDPIRGAVAAMESVIDGAVALLTDLHERLEAALADDDMESVQEIADEISERKDALAAAIAQNTVAAAEADDSDASGGEPQPGDDAIDTGLSDDDTNDAGADAPTPTESGSL